MYITYSDVSLRYPIIKTWISESPILANDIITYAEHELNSRLSTHYSVPFSAAHPTVKDLCIDLSYLRTLRNRDTKQAGVLKKYIDERIENLKTGKEYIMTDSYTYIEPDATKGNQEIWSTVMDYHPVHSMLDADNAYTNIDSNRIQDEEDERA
jgi:hypothetical protein